MPFMTSFFRSVLDYFYALEGDAEDDSTAEEQPRNTPPAQVRADTRVKRENAKRQAQQTLRNHTAFTPLDNVQKLPDDLPPFNGMVASSLALSSPSSSPPAERKVKKWRSATSVPDVKSPKAKNSKKRSQRPNETGIQEPQIRWSVDESELTKMNVDGVIYKKYMLFKENVVKFNCSPFQKEFEPLRWGVKKTQQKKDIDAYSARLNLSHRVVFFINEAEKKVVIYSVDKHA